MGGIKKIKQNVGPALPAPKRLAPTANVFGRKLFATNTANPIFGSNASAANNAEISPESPVSGVQVARPTMNSLVSSQKYSSIRNPDLIMPKAQEQAKQGKNKLNKPLIPTAPVAAQAQAQSGKRGGK